MSANGGPSLEFVTRRFLIEAARARGWKPSTIVNYRYTLDRFVEHVGAERPVGTLTKKHVQAYLTEFAPGRRTGYVRQTISILSSWATWMLDEGYLRKNPLYGIRPPRKPRRLPRGIKPAEVQAILGACRDARAELMIMLGVQEGLRRFEIAGIQFADIDLDDRSLRVVGKRGAERLLPLSAETLATMARYLSEHPAASGPLLRSYVSPERGISAGLVGQIVADAFKAAGVKKAPFDGRSCHALRHSCASHMIKNGAHILDVKAALGHQHLSTTEIYLPLQVKHLREAMGGRRYRGAKG